MNEHFAKRSLVVVGATKKIKSISALSKHTFKSFASSGGISTTQAVAGRQFSTLEK
jgi:hypothetical protein